MLCQNLCGFLADLADAQSIDQILQRILLAVLNGIQQLIYRLFLKALQIDQLLAMLL